jgi:hypothetical protein
MLGNWRTSTEGLSRSMVYNKSWETKAHVYYNKMYNPCSNLPRCNPSPGSLCAVYKSFIYKNWSRFVYKSHLHKTIVRVSGL